MNNLKTNAIPAPHSEDFQVARGYRQSPEEKDQDPVIAYHGAGAILVRANLEAAKRAADVQLMLAGVYNQEGRYEAGGHLPPPIARFLATYWRTYLLRLYRLEGGESPKWLEAVETMSELTWSLHPKQNAASRHRLLSLLPCLYQKLQVGLESIGLEAAEKDHFFSELASLNQAALEQQAPAAETTS